MNYRKLKRADLDISEIGFGCMSLDLKNPDEELLRSAFELGINYFDTADLYDHGKNEELVGRALKPVRDRIVLATKVGNEWLPDGRSWRWNPGKAYIVKAAEESLRRLQTDRIDLYQLHGGTIDDPIDEVIEAFEHLQEPGKILHYGLSSIRPNVIRAYAERTAIVSDMLQYSLLDRRPEEELLDVLSDLKIGVIVRGALAKGLLAGKPAAEYMDHSEVEVDRLRKGLADLASEKRTPGQTALRYILAHPAVTSVVVGIRTPDQLTEAVQAVDTPVLTSAERENLANLLPPNQYTAHR